jgi:hypothetical protein
VVQLLARQQVVREVHRQVQVPLMVMVWESSLMWQDRPVALVVRRQAAQVQTFNGAMPECFPAAEQAAEDIPGQSLRAAILPVTG